MNKEFVKKVFVNILQVVIIFMTVFGVLITFEYVQQGNNREEEMSKVSLYQKRPDGELVRVLGETAQSYEGDRFIVQDITLGGETLMAMIADDKTRGIEISHLQGRLYQFSEDEGVNYYASWQSNKPTLSTVSYKKEQDAELEEVSEDNFGYAHTVILSDIDLESSSVLSTTKTN